MHSHVSAAPDFLPIRKPRELPPPPSNFDATPQSLLDNYLKMPTAERQRRFASTYDVARKLDLTRHTIQNWINEGSIAAVRIGKKKYQVDLRSVEAFVRKCETEREAR